ncbi:MAG: Fic family protein [Actinobacteria bacterium]|nr:Fic family protein [Actinomycetota bacterium]
MRFSRTPHLVSLVAEAERLAARLDAAPSEARAKLADLVRAESAIATLRLDGSPIAEPPRRESVEARLDATERPRSGTWLDAFGVVDDVHDDALQTLEYHGVQAAYSSEDLAERLLTDLAGALAPLHHRLTRGLIAEVDAGRLRTSHQAVHDASQGRIIYFATDPDRIADCLAHLSSWMASVGAREHGLLTSGVLHYDLLVIHPFEAANGRLARVAARLVLRARGLDPSGLAAPEPVIVGDAIGYYEEVARTTRRRDATIWLERWGEAVCAGLRASARRLGALEVEVPPRALAFIEALPDRAFTVADYRADVHVGPEDTRADLVALLDSGTVDRVAGSRGLRFRVL